MDEPKIAVNAPIHIHSYRENYLTIKGIKKEVRHLEVPLINQMDHPRLYNGCEVTSLAMILNFKGIPATKTELADRIHYVPFKYPDGLFGNPNVGFVGNMKDGPGLGVYHEPIFNLAKSYANERVEDLTGQSFDEILKRVAADSPVWVITTTHSKPVSNFKFLDTPQGREKVTFNMHSVVITGYDQDNIFVNDPYGTKDKIINKVEFIQSWEQMGRQAIVIN